MGSVSAPELDKLTLKGPWNYKEPGTAPTPMWKERVGRLCSTRAPKVWDTVRRQTSRPLGQHRDPKHRLGGGRPLDLWPTSDPRAVENR